MSKGLGVLAQNLVRSFEFKADDETCFVRSKVFLATRGGEYPLLVDTVEKVPDRRCRHPIGLKMLIHHALKTTPRPKTRALLTFSTISVNSGQLDHHLGHIADEKGFLASPYILYS